MKSQLGSKTFVQLKFRNFFHNPETANFSSDYLLVSNREIEAVAGTALASYPGLGTRLGRLPFIIGYEGEVILTNTFRDSTPTAVIQHKHSTGTERDNISESKIAIFYLCMESTIMCITSQCSSKSVKHCFTGVPIPIYSLTEEYAGAYMYTCYMEQRINVCRTERACML